MNPPEEIPEELGNKRLYLQGLIDDADDDTNLLREITDKEPLEDIEVNELEDEEVDELIDELENPDI